MSRPVFHYDSASEASVGSEVVLDGPEGHHAATVRRLRAGEPILLTDGRGVSLATEVVRVGRRDVTVAVRAVTEVEPPPLRITIVQALAKGDRGDRAVELLTEVGVDTIVPWQAVRCVSRWDADKRGRGQAKWQASAHAAAKQSRRVWWPVVEPAVELTELLALVRVADCAFVLHETAGRSLAVLVDEGAVPARGWCLVVVGPEGGISDPELEELQAVGAVPVRLGETVLRTSTAGLVAATLVLSRSASWRSTLEP